VCFRQPEGFADCAGGVGVALGSGEIAKEEVDAGELAQRGGFAGFVASALVDSPAFLNGAAGLLEVVSSSGFAPARTGAFSLVLPDDADVLRRLADADLILQLRRQPAGLQIDRRAGAPAMSCAGRYTAPVPGAGPVNTGGRT
jgi:hypothetical protein